MTIFIIMTLGIGLILGPMAAASTGYTLGGAASATCVLSGSVITLLAGIALVFTRLYQKTKASEAFVRTGSGGVKVIRDGGAIIIPVLHALIRVSLQTLKLEIVREQQDALITQDKLRADIRAEFFVRVQPDRESILQASRSLGDRMGNPQAVKELIEDKLVSALRTAAAGKTLEQLNSERDEFLAEVMKLVGEDLRSNGLVLETATISKLDQTDDEYLKAENIFDAQGRRKIAEITQVNLTQRNQSVREGEQARKQQDVVTRQAVLEFDRQEKEAEARQCAEVAKIDAEAKREAQVKAIEAQRGIDLAAVQKQRELEVAARQQQQAVEVAEREKQETVALAEKRRAAAERELADAEAERERARQNVESVKCAEEAERAKRRQVIEAQAQAETKYVSSQRQADAEAYSKQKQAEASRLAAHAEAEALRQQAAAEAEAERKRAEGRTAIEMVPVQVQRAQVEVDRDRLETVVKPELQAREAHGKVAQDFELRKLAVEADREVRIATAQATASVFTRMEAKLFGTPDEVNKLLDSLLTGKGLATTAEAFFDAADDRTKSAVEGITAGLSGLASAAAQRLSGAEPSEATPSSAAPEAEGEIAVGAFDVTPAEPREAEAIVVD